ncbi:GAF domain-containing protein [Agrobacterium sp.]|uniref:GAF domain-containing protein n=1 Tax=Agrobacterium sp. TaxID=361 RepID=UPI0028A7B25E|nr:GAF domain-containing protein [Agrobacterium sp.]
MFATGKIETADKQVFYRELSAQLEGLLHGERDFIANAANFSALIYSLVPDLNWAGFYFLKQKDELVLGPFQGKVACVRIPVGKGVCGAVVATGKTQLVPDVHAFPGHIACDAASRSELVVPLVKGDRMIGVLDLDSPLPGRFDAEDQAGFEALAALYIEASDF